jgi:hypothetical protein
MWRRVDLVQTDVSEEHIASIFRVENKKKSAEIRFMFYLPCVGAGVREEELVLSIGPNWVGFFYLRTEARVQRPKRFK